MLVSELENSIATFMTILYHDSSRFRSVLFKIMDILCHSLSVYC